MPTAFAAVREPPHRRHPARARCRCRSFARAGDGRRPDRDNASRFVAPIAPAVAARRAEPAGGTVAARVEFGGDEFGDELVDFGGDALANKFD
jgi:hypothetical protein